LLLGVADFKITRMAAKKLDRRLAAAAIGAVAAYVVLA